nr:MAG TPA: hypothetical protein [Caudoviricetes sp.]
MRGFLLAWIFIIENVNLRKNTYKFRKILVKC